MLNRKRTDWRSKRDLEWLRKKRQQPCCWDRFECEKFCDENVSRHCVSNVWIGVSFTIRCTSTWAVLHYKHHDNGIILQLQRWRGVWGLRYLHSLEMMFRYILHQSVSHSRMHLFLILVSHFLPADRIECCDFISNAHEGGIPLQNVSEWDRETACENQW